ncbi:hypothetical protein Cgig2_008900 [Carnegiea gigantea]|uniref:Uncharacterized protein n=1 Tax=Carnegiea gigantea TaxID=171969 RepID=A0A9Q1KL85_9CARY|nr:hypothetical protein Cgig2_008900 [Carnegiea gigantea]
MPILIELAYPYPINYLRYPITRRKQAGGLGIPKIRALNAAASMNLGWRMILEPIKSHAWGGIVEQRRRIEEHTGMALEDGRTTRCWLGRWVEPSPLLIFATQYAPLTELEKRAHEYWDEQGGRRWEAFLDFLPHPVLIRIASFELLEEGVDGNFYWIGDNDGKFKLQAAISIIQDKPAISHE